MSRTSIRTNISIQGDSFPSRDIKTIYGCLFCRSGIEDRIISELKITMPGLSVISPKKIRIRRYANEAVEELATLFPGYLFFFADGEIDFRELLRKQDIYRLLSYPNGEWMLSGADRMIAELMFDNGGVIGLSKAFYEGTIIRISDGPLKNMEGSIIRVNKRMKTVEVGLELMGKKVKLWLGYEIVEEK